MAPKKRSASRSGSWQRMGAGSRSSRPGIQVRWTRSSRAGGQPLAIERDAGGLRVDSLKQLLARHHVHALYIAASCNNPTGGRTAPHRRERIAALAADHELTVIEDTVLDELCFDGDPGVPLWALLPERVLAAGSLSKVAWGGLRVGWLRAPRPVILRLARIKGALNIGVGAFDQLAALTILDDYPAALPATARTGQRAHARNRGRTPPRATRVEHPSPRGRLVTMARTHPPAAAQHSRKPRCATASPSPRRREQPRRRIPGIRTHLLRRARASPQRSRPKTGRRMERPHNHRSDRQPDQRLTTTHQRHESQASESDRQIRYRPRGDTSSSRWRDGYDRPPSKAAARPPRPLQAWSSQTGVR